MKTARDHKTGYFITAVTFVMRYGNNANEKGEHAICPVCRQNVNIRGNHQSNRRIHFLHFPNAQCPIVENGGNKYSCLVSIEENPLTIEKRKRDFEELTVKAYLKCHMLCDHKLTLSEYEGLLKLATNKGMWNYHGLVLEYIPYILLTYKDLTRKGYMKRPFNLRFVFSSIINNYSDLWINPKGNTNIIRLSLKGTAIIKQECYILNLLFHEDDWLSPTQRALIVNRTKAVTNF